MIIYILEWGYDRYKGTSLEIINRLVYLTLEDACSKAMTYYKDCRPNIIKYDLETHETIKEYTNIPALDAEISAVTY